MSSSAEQPSQQPKREWPKILVTSVLLPITLTSLTLFFLQPIAERHAKRPDIKVLGALPLALLEASPGESPAKYRHRLAFILKVENTSPTPTLIHTVLIDGCVKMDHFPNEAEMSIPREHHVSEERDWEDLSSRHKDTVQRLLVTSSLQQTPSGQSASSAVIPAYSTDYIGLTFHHETSSEAFHTRRGSASLTGNCSEIQTPNPYPSVFQLINTRSSYESTSLRPELLDGRLTVSLITSTQQAIIKPGIIKPIRILRLESWPNLDLSQIYENPQVFPPPQRPLASVPRP
jgi:hypothetical protein